MLNLTDLSDEPLQSQISSQLRAMILTGELAAGKTLPSIRALARQQHVSVITVQRGYEMLEREGLIHSRRGKGFFVSEIDETMKKTLARQRLTEALEPLVKAAVSEGMSAGDITDTFKTTLKKQTRKR